MLGIMPSPSFPGIEIGLDPGDTLVLSTDGLIDHNPCIGNDDDLSRTVASPPGTSADALLSELEHAAPAAPPAGT